MNKLKYTLLAALLAFGQAVVGADLVVGGMAGKESDLLYAAQKVAKEKFNLDVKIVTFDDFVTPNIALNDGDLDLNAFQHRPYLESMVKDRGFKLSVVGETFVFPIGAYSKKYKDIKQLPQGARIAIPNDPSNGARALILLAKHGLIELDDINNLQASPLNVVKNPHKFKFQEVDAAQLPRMLDEVDAAFINSVFSVQANLLPTKDAILVEAADSPYMNIIVARTADKDKPQIKQFVEAYHSDAVKQAAEKAFKGAQVPSW